MSDLGGGALQFLADPLDAFGARGAKRSAELAEETAGLQLGESQRQFDVGQQRLEPFFQEAVPAFQRQAALAGAQGPEAQGQAFGEFQESPGVDFLREQGLRLINSGAGAAGGLGGGERLRELTKFSQGLALQDLSNQFNRLGVVSGSGQAVAERQAGLGANFAGQTAQILGNQLAGQQAGIAGQQQATSNLLGTAAGVAGIVASDEDLKTDIREISNKDCFDHVMNTPMHAWRYLEGAGVDTDMHIGPMWQESPDCIKADGVKALDLHDELWLIAGAIKHMVELQNG